MLASRMVQIGRERTYEPILASNVGSRKKVLNFQISSSLSELKAMIYNQK